MNGFGSSRLPEPGRFNPSFASGGLATDSRSKDTPVTDVVYVGGAGRSGSTVLALLLAQLPGFVAIGGVTNLWERGLQQNYLCGCGAPFRSCEFWLQVGDTAFGGWEQVNVADVLRLKSSVTRYRHWPAYFAPRVGEEYFAPCVRREFFTNAAEYSEYTRRVYTAVATVSDSSTVVDNSHDISPALVLARTEDVQGHILHLVRDSRGVVFSLARYVARAEATSAAAYMPRSGPIRASTEWVAANLPYHFIPSRTLPRLRVRYESLVASPAVEISRIVEFLGGKSPASAFSVYEADSIEIGENHMISGNPHRLGRKRLELRLDEEWRIAMKPANRLLTTLLTLPFIFSYGYVSVNPFPDRR
jgi:hypothetical protein